MSITYMEPDDYLCLPNFTAREVEKAGGDPLKMQRQAMLKLQDFRTLIDRRFIFTYNGLNSGNHSADSEHDKGTAFDGYLSKYDGEVTQDVIYTTYIAALQAGFRGIGIYYNGVQWSFHLDTRNEFTFWTGRKKAPGASGWVYRRMQFGIPA